MNLVIDFGNTRIKGGIFDSDKLMQIATGIEEIRTIISRFNPQHVIVSSVSATEEEIKSLLQRDIIFLSHTTKLPFQLKYKTPETLGLDRIAAVAGAQSLFPNRNCLVIDTGTCITYDILDSENNHLGGSISPGIAMRFKALNTFTAKLPLVELNESIELIGNTTAEAMQSGVLHGIVGEMKQIIRMYKDKFANLQIIICGGDAKFFENKLKEGIFAAPELVLTGLNRILQYNV